MTEYTDEQRIEALARIEAGESQREVASGMGIPLATVNRWAIVTREVAEAVLAADGVLDDETKTQYAARWGKVQRLVAQRAASNVEALPETGLTPSQIRDLSITGGIATDKWYDLTEGRKGAQIDARSVHLTVPAEQALDMLRMLELSEGKPDNGSTNG